eukprot:GFUD01002191.1.p1 GENE.GFUD01002191.1~~GFUD01002191.1.p1  ORF type:complete len:380 (+),score=82.91 GFUD01002191.1:109-1248(+)
MLTLANTLFYLHNTYKHKGRSEDDPKQASHPFKSEKYQEEKFPQSFQFLDFQWTPEGLSGQFRGVMSGLKPLTWDCLLQVDTRCFAKEVQMKKALLDKNGKYQKLVTAGLQTRLDAQKELLELIVGNLKTFHQEHFEVTNEFVKVHVTGEIFRFSKYEEEPLILLAQLVQEDFTILEYDDIDSCWRFASGFAAFSFVELGINGERSFMKPGADVATIHTPVPGFNPGIYKQVSNYFKALKDDNAFWRANWIVTPLEGISPFEEEILEGADTEERHRSGGLDDQTKSASALLDLGTKTIPELAVRSEYQTIFKLPTSGCLVFGIHSYIDPLESLVLTPKAAAMVARTTKNMDKKTLKYRGINQAAQENIVLYCSEVARNA